MITPKAALTKACFLAACRSAECSRTGAIGHGCTDFSSSEGTVKRTMLGMTVVTSILCATAMPSVAGTGRIDLLGSPAPATVADYTVHIAPETRYVNVKLGDTVKFVAGGKEFTWSFDSENVWAVDLAQIAPAGMLERGVIAYVSPFRRYFGRNDN
jgi:hypothetical protein